MMSIYEQVFTQKKKKTMPHDTDVRGASWSQLTAGFNQTWTFNVQLSEIRHDFLKDRP